MLGALNFVFEVISAVWSIGTYPHCTRLTLPIFAQIELCFRSASIPTRSFAELPSTVFCSIRLIWLERLTAVFELQYFVLIALRAIVSFLTAMLPSACWRRFLTQVVL